MWLTISVVQEIKSFCLPPPNASRHPSNGGLIRLRVTRKIDFSCGRARGALEHSKPLFSSRCASSRFAVSSLAGYSSISCDHHCQPGSLTTSLRKEFTSLMPKFLLGKLSNNSYLLPYSSSWPALTCELIYIITYIRRTTSS